MSDANQKLIELVTREVVAVLRERGLIGGSVAPSSSPTSPAHDVSRTLVRPPLGTCTGDYSKFPELRGRLYADAAKPVSNSASPPPTIMPVPLTGIVTANQLQHAMDTAADGVAHLAHDTRLTPLAGDLARLHPKRVRRLTAQEMAANVASTAGGTTHLPWLWWIEGECPAVNELVARLSGRVYPSSAPRSAQGLSQIVRELSASVRARRIAGGLLFVPNAARAMCFANRCLSLRAVVGTCDEAVEQGIDELGANVLVIEYPHQGSRAMDALVRKMLQQNPKSPAQIERELADLHRCG